ncbi:MAG: hypothetical protein LBS19_03865 [Clostridiales bacterium]|jgi:HPt (histidine-containing phosphotransfer) domain-containing protein|nr:hypothetical protein [Clostridiales bacterium]
MESFEQYPFIDVEEGLGRTMNNKKLYAKLLNTFIKNTMESALLAAIGEKNLEAALSTAHAIKGVTANLSLLRLRYYITWLERELKTDGLDAAAFTGAENDRIKEYMQETAASAERTAAKLSN